MTTRGLLAPLPRWREFTDLGVVAPGAKLYFYVAGTSTPATTYSNVDLATIHQNTNPVVASSGGLFGPIYLAFGVLYDVVLTESDGTPIWSQPNVGGTGIQGTVFDVTAYGAVGNGTTDDTAAIQAALDAAAANTGGGVVYFPTGTYKLTAALSLTTAHVRLLGSGRAEAVLQWTDTASKGLVIAGSASAAAAPLLAANAVIGDRTVVVGSGAGLATGRWAYLQSNGATTGAFITKIASVAGVNVTLEEAMPIGLLTADAAVLISYDALLAGISVRSLTFSCVAGAATANKLTLLEVRRCDAPEVVDVAFDGCVGPLITPVACKNGTIRECTFRNAFTVAGSATEIQTSTGFSVENCWSNNCRFGITATRSPRTRFVNCSCSGIPDASGGRSMKLSATSNFSVIENCTNNDTGFSGCRVENSAYCSVVGLTCFAMSVGQNGAGCIEIAGASAQCVHCTISGCTIVGGEAQACGIALTFDVGGLDTFCTVVGNNISGCVRTALFCNGSRNIIAGNILGSSDAVEFLLIVDGSKNIIDDNTFVAENGSVAAALDTTSSGGSNIIGVNKHATANAFNLHATDIVTATTIWKPQTDTQTAVHTGANTTETTAWDVPIPGGTFVVANSAAAGFRHMGYFEFAANNNDKTIKYKLGDAATPTVTIAFAILGANANGAHVEVMVEAFSIAGAVAGWAKCIAMLPAGTVSFISIIGFTATDDFTVTEHSKFTMTNGSAVANDMNFGAGKFVYESVLIRPTPAA